MTLPQILACTRLVHGPRLDGTWRRHKRSNTFYVNLVCDQSLFPINDSTFEQSKEYLRRHHCLDHLALTSKTHTAAMDGSLPSYPLTAAKIDWIQTPRTTRDAYILADRLGLDISQSIVDEGNNDFKRHLGYPLRRLLKPG